MSSSFARKDRSGDTTKKKPGRRSDRAQVLVLYWGKRDLSRSRLFQQYVSY
jgi:hypothetical protein